MIIYNYRGCLIDRCLNTLNNWPFNKTFSHFSGELIENGELVDAEELKAEIENRNNIELACSRSMPKMLLLRPKE